MDSQIVSPPQHMDASRPSLGFPLGTALLLIIIFSLSGFFSCCYHWDKLRSLRRSFSNNNPHPEDHHHHHHPIQSPPNKSSLTFPKSKQNPNESLPVIMPGDQIPKFIALPCPCQPPRATPAAAAPTGEKITILVQTPPPPQPPPPPSPPLTTLVYNHVGRFGVYYNG